MLSSVLQTSKQGLGRADPLSLFVDVVRDEKVIDQASDTGRGYRNPCLLSDSWRSGPALDYACTGRLTYQGLHHDDGPATLILEPKRYLDPPRLILDCNDPNIVLHVDDSKDPYEPDLDRIDLDDQNALPAEDDVLLEHNSFKYIKYEMTRLAEKILPFSKRFISRLLISNRTMQVGEKFSRGLQAWFCIPTASRRAHRVLWMNRPSKRLRNRKTCTMCPRMTFTLRPQF